MESLDKHNSNKGSKYTIIIYYEKDNYDSLCNEMETSFTAPIFLTRLRSSCRILGVSLVQFKLSLTKNF